MMQVVRHESYMFMCTSFTTSRKLFVYSLIFGKTQFLSFICIFGWIRARIHCKEIGSVRWRLSVIGLRANYKGGGSCCIWVCICCIWASSQLWGGSCCIWVCICFIRASSQLYESEGLQTFGFVFVLAVFGLQVNFMERRIFLYLDAPSGPHSAYL